MNSRTKFRNKLQIHVPVLQRVLQMLCRADENQAQGLVLDPFAGTGSTGVAARSLGCVFIGLDKDPLFKIGRAHV